LGLLDAVAHLRWAVLLDNKSRLAGGKEIANNDEILLLSFPHKACSTQAIMSF